MQFSWLVDCRAFNMWLLLQASADTGVAGPDAANHAADLDKTSEGLLIHMLPYIILGASVVLCTSILKYVSSSLKRCLWPE